MYGIKGQANKLDKAKPNWFNIVKPSRLCLAFSETCVLGQAYHTEGHRRGMTGFRYATSYANFHESAGAYGPWPFCRTFWILAIMRRRNLISKAADIFVADYLARGALDYELDQLLIEEAAKTSI